MTPYGVEILNAYKLKADPTSVCVEGSLFTAEAVIKSIWEYQLIQVAYLMPDYLAQSDSLPTFKRYSFLMNKTDIPIPIKRIKDNNRNQRNTA